MFFGGVLAKAVTPFLTTPDMRLMISGGLSTSTTLSGVTSSLGTAVAG